jgi:membrane-bound lytic murein transglycosylase B
MIPRSYPQIPLWFKRWVTPWGILGIVVVSKAADLGLLEANGQPVRWSAAATAEIPTTYRKAYERAAARCPGLSSTVLAAVGKVESDHGRSRLRGVHAGRNRSGAAGPMQLGIGGKAGPTWQHYRTDGDGDGDASVYAIDDAAAAAAKKLCHDGARHGRDVRGALFAYNHSRPYVTRVLKIAAHYDATGGGAKRSRRQRPAGTAHERG